MEAYRNDYRYVLVYGIVKVQLLGIGGRMEQVIDNLKNKEIIYKKSIEKLKNHIKNKYPDAGDVFRAQVFADAVHKIIDNHIREFRREDQKKIKSLLLKTTATKETFEIVAYDIIKTCVSLGIDEDSFVDDMTSWINRQQPIPVYRQQMLEIQEVIKENIRIEEENRYATNVSRDANLLKQLEAAFDYKAKYDREPPELFVEGAINEAYESEISKEKKASFEKEKAKTGEDQFVGDVSGDTLAKVDNELIDDLFTDTGMNDEGHEVLNDDGRPVIKVKSSSQMDLLMSDKEIETETVTRGAKFFDKLPQQWTMKELIVYGLLTVAAVVVVTLLIWQMVQGPQEEQVPEEVESISKSMVLTSSANVNKKLESNEDVVGASNIGKTDVVLAEHLRYKVIDQKALKEWLLKRGSLIGEHPYFDTVLEVAQAYDVNPLLLFAIAGQEQDFVPRKHPQAEVIINNPFNVFISWEDYNTNFEESVQIASRTLYTASEGLPVGEDPIQWINGTYAEDPNWSEGVTTILKQLEVVAGIDRTETMH